MKIKIFTHNDLDGYSCSILAQLVAGREHVSAEYCGYHNINEKIIDFIEKKEYKFYDLVLITDISINEKVAETIDSYYFDELKNKKLKEIFCLIDHHATVTWLNKYDWCTVQVEDDTEKVCGTSLLYDYFIKNNLLEPKASVEIFIEAVKRYDTWLWHDKYNDLRAKSLNDLFELYGPDRFVDEFYKRLTSNVFCMFTDKDMFALELENGRIQNYINRKSNFIYKKKITLNNKTFKAGIVVASQYLSELGNKLSEDNPDLDFIVMIADLNTISFRTVKDNIDLGKDVAKHFGGGGHPKASGAPISFELKKQILDFII